MTFNAEQTDQTIPMIFQIGFFYIVQELYMHRVHLIMHKVKFLYNYIHTVHHQISGDSFIVAFYMHPLEIVFFIYPNLMLGPILLHWYLGFLYKESMIIWTIVATFYFIWSHSGVMDSPYMPSAKWHYLHHKYQLGNFGSWITDNIFGTAIQENRREQWVIIFINTTSSVNIFYKKTLLINASWAVEDRRW
jgi:sterol desaturase/sphingolipid hydroxylase (fatty acid hydroxylase superfamily)